ncbi:MAG: hypothetical protein HY235_15195 [Acidobacteria bacterium]|nr:hypothetical protein [Acidobacteriota bacterium]
MPPPEILVPDNRSLQMVVNAYQVCRDNIVALKRARIPQSEFTRLAQELERRFLSTLESNVGSPPLLQTDIGTLRSDLYAGSEEEALVRCGAFLKALARHVSHQLRRQPDALKEPVETSANLGSRRYFVAPKLPNLSEIRLPGSKRLSRTDEEVAEMPSSYHAGLDIWPERAGEWALVRIPLRDPVTDTLLRKRLKNGTLKVAMSPLTLDADIRGRCEPGFPSNEPARFIVDSVGVEPPQLATLQHVLQRCRDEEVSVLVLPELRMPPNFTALAADFLRDQPPAELKQGRGLLLVAAGSWHVRSPSGREWVNQAILLDHAGRRLWTHDKLAEFRITPENLTADPHLSARLGLNRHGGVEAIRVGDRLEFCDFSIGRVAVAICVGFFHAPLESLLKESRAGVFLVPAMSPVVTDMADRARALVRSQRAFTFVANCGSVARKAKGQVIKEGACFFQSPFSRYPVEATDELLIFNPQLITALTP